MSDKLEFLCMYCGNSWTEPAYYYSEREPMCSQCKDRNIKVTRKDASKSDIFGYNSDKARPDAYIKKDRK